MRHSRRIVALAGVVTALGLATDGSAQPPQVEQSAEVGSAAAVTSVTPFQQYVFRDPCPSATKCTLDFTTVPTGSRLNITNTSCYIETDVSKADAEISFLQLLVNNRNNTPTTASTLVPVFVSEANNLLVYSVNHSVSVFANAGQHFQADLGITNLGTVFLFACHISGQLQKLG